MSEKLATICIQLLLLIVEETTMQRDKMLTLEAIERLEEAFPFAVVPGDDTPYSPLNLAAEAIYKLPVNEWASWISYLVENLDGKARGDEAKMSYEMELASLIEAMQMRLQEGGW